MTKTRKTYKGEDGTEYRLVEATHDLFIKVWRRHCKKAIPGSTTHCVVAVAIEEHDDNIMEVCITCGRDAWVIMKSDEYPDGVAFHFVLNMTPQRVRDKFDTDKTIKSQGGRAEAPDGIAHDRGSRCFQSAAAPELADGTGKPYRPRIKPITTGGAIRLSRVVSDDKFEPTPRAHISRDGEKSGPKPAPAAPRTRVSTYDNETLIQMRARARISRGGVEVPTGAE